MRILQDKRLRSVAPSEKNHSQQETMTVDIRNQDPSLRVKLHVVFVGLLFLSGCDQSSDVAATSISQNPSVDQPQLNDSPTTFEVPIGNSQTQSLSPHPDAVRNSHAVGDVDKPELVRFIVPDPAALRGIVVDEVDATLVGNWQYSTHTPPYVGIGYLHDQKDGKGTKSVTFTPNLPSAGEYEVRVSHCYNVRRAINTPVLIHHADGEIIVRINQQETPEFKQLFRSVGKFRFEAGKQGWVRISTDGTDGKYVIADAVQFVPLSANTQNAKAATQGERSAGRSDLRTFTSVP